jgi:NhaP-type Na+/H+ or K+/H+ antiporter
LDPIITEQILKGLSVVFVIGIGAQWLAWKLKLPSILLLLIGGLIAGPVAGLVNPTTMFGDLLFPLVSISVGLILFEGGLTLKWEELKEAGDSVRNMVTLGVLVTWLLTALAAHYVLSLSVPAALVLGSILVVTGPTVIGPLLRHIQPSPRVSTIAKWEGIVIDPVGAVLAVLVFEAVSHAQADGLGETFKVALKGMISAVVIGGCIGSIFSWVLITAMKRYWIPDFLENACMVMFVIAAYTLSHMLQHESGLYTVTLMGILISNQKSVTVHHIIEFKENLRTILISVLFILLVTCLEMRHLKLISWNHFSFLALMILVIRPAAVFLSTLKSKINWREKLLLSWLAPRGVVAAAVASVLGFRFAEEGQMMVATTFLVIFVTVVFYGLSAAPMARLLKLATPNPQGILLGGANRFARMLASAIQDEGFAVRLIDSNRINIRRARMMNLPAEYADLLSENALNDIQLSGIGRMLALTPNHEVNSLAALRYAEVFGRNSVFQLCSDVHLDAKTSISQHLRGRLLFNNEAHFGELQRRISEDSKISSTSLTEEFGYQDYMEKYGDRALVLCVIKSGKELILNEAANPVEPGAGDAVISMIMPGVNIEGSEVNDEA